VLASPGDARLRLCARDPSILAFRCAAAVRNFAVDGEGMLRRGLQASRMCENARLPTAKHRVARTNRLRRRRTRFGWPSQPTNGRRLLAADQREASPRSRPTGGVSSHGNEAARASLRVASARSSI